MLLLLALPTTITTIFTIIPTTTTIITRALVALVLVELQAVLAVCVLALVAHAVLVDFDQCAYMNTCVHTCPHSPARLHTYMHVTSCADAWAKANPRPK